MWEEVEYPSIEPEHMDTSDLKFEKDKRLDDYCATIEYLDGAGLIVTDWILLKAELRRYLYG